MRVPADVVLAVSTGLETEANADVYTLAANEPGAPSGNRPLELSDRHTGGEESSLVDVVMVGLTPLRVELVGVEARDAKTDVLGDAAPGQQPLEDGNSRDDNSCLDFVRVVMRNVLWTPRACERQNRKGTARGNWDLPNTTRNRE